MRQRIFNRAYLDKAEKGILSYDYKPFEFWKANFPSLKALIANHKRANPTIRRFKKIGTRVYPR